MQPTQQMKVVEQSRAKQIDHGTLIESMENVVLGLPAKPDPIRFDITRGITPSWNFEQLVSQKQLLADILVTNDSPFTIWQYRHTWKTIEDMFFKGLGRNFMYFNWNVNFHVQIRSNFQQVGMMMLAFCNIPERLFTDIFLNRGTLGFTSRPLLWQLPHRKIPFGEDQDIEITLNYNSPFSHIPSSKNFVNSQDIDYDMGTLSLFNIFPMTMAQGVDPACSVRIWASLSDVSYSGYDPTGSTIFG